MEKVPHARHESRIRRGFDRILVVRLGAMGDIVHALPAVATIRRAFPQSRIDWVVEERWADLLCSRIELQSAPRLPEKPLVDQVLTVDTRRWRKSLTARETREAFGSVLRRLRSEKYDAAIDLQGLVKSAILMRLAGARARFGFARPAEKPAGLMYTRRFVARGTHIVDQNISLALAITASAGIAAQPVQGFELPKDPLLESWADHELTRRGLKDFCVLSPGAGWGAKQWPAERYGEVARSLPIPSLVNYGPGEESLAREVEAHSGGKAQPISCAVGKLISLIRRARIYVGGDTGPTHIGAALGIPVVGIYGPTNPARNGPYGNAVTVLRSQSSVTSHARLKNPESGLLEITSEEVLSAANEMLSRGAR